MIDTLKLTALQCSCFVFLLIACAGPVLCSSECPETNDNDDQGGYDCALLQVVYSLSDSKISDSVRLNYLIQGCETNEYGLWDNACQLLQDPKTRYRGLSELAINCDEESIRSTAYYFLGEYQRLFWSVSETSIDLAPITWIPDFQIEDVAEIAREKKVAEGFIRSMNPLAEGAKKLDILFMPSSAPEVLIDKSDFMLYLLVDDCIVSKWPVAVGKPGRSTPIGSFSIKGKVVNPCWTHPRTGQYKAPGAADNPVGTRWMQIAPHIGIHGTIAPESISTRASLGCIRMFIQDSETLFDLVEIGTKVTVRE